MNIFFLFKNFNLNKCGISDYIENLSHEFHKSNIKPIILSDIKIKSKLIKKICTVYIPWNLFKIIKYFKKNNKGIFFLQYSPFSYSKSGFSFTLILLLFYLYLFKKNIKIVVNFHEIRNKFSINPKYFFLFLLHTVQFYLIYHLSKNIYYTNNEFIYDLPILKNQKCFFQEIFPNISQNKLVKKKNQIIFFCSHYNFLNYYIFLSYIKNYQFVTKNKFKIMFIGNVNSNIQSKIISLIGSLDIKNFELKFFSTKEDFSKQLSISKAVFVTNGYNFKINSGLLVAALVCKNVFFFLKKPKENKYLNKIFFTVDNQHSFNKIINYVLQNKKIILVKKIYTIKFNIKLISKIFIKNFKFLVK